MAAMLRILSLTLVLMASGALLAESKAEKTGRELHEELLQTERFYADEALNQYVESVGQKLVAASGWEEFDFHFFILDDPGINAFAFPGGYVYINRGLLTYMNSEAQLAAVLGHEIAHVTRDHHSRQQNAAGLAKLASFVSTVATWNSNVGDAIDIWNAARISGFGREMELEADEYGATYLYRSGYDPNAIIEILSILKDHETLSSSEARAAGQQGTYHGVFSTHPRSDTRLREVVSQAGMLAPGEAFVGRDEFRQYIDAMTFGPSLDANAPPGMVRYVHKGLAITFVHPADWSRHTQGSTILVQSPDSSRQIELSVQRMEDASLNAQDLLLAATGASEIRRKDPIYSNVDEDQAITGFIDTSGGLQRVAGIKLGSNFYLFRVLAPLDASDALDEKHLLLISSFRQATQSDLPPERELSIYFKRLEPGETFAELASKSVLGNRAEPYLRLINGYYPSGEAAPGTWMKLVH